MRSKHFISRCKSCGGLLHAGVEEQRSMFKLLYWRCSTCNILEFSDSTEALVQEAIKTKNYTYKGGYDLLKESEVT